MTSRTKRDVGLDNDQTGTFDSALAHVRGLLLSADEGNRPEYLNLVASALAAVPEPRNGEDAYVGSTGPRSPQYLATESLPESGLPGEIAVAQAMGAMDGQIRWHSEMAMHNVNQPALLPSAAAHAVTSLLNPNALWDLVSGGCLDMERQVARQMAALLGWAPDTSDGVFTFGGKGGIIYAIRLGLNRCLPGSAAHGLARGGATPVVLTTAENHYSVSSAAALVGIGTDSVVHVPTRDRAMDPAAFREIMDRLAHENRPVAAVVLCGSNTLDAVVDPIEAIVGEMDASVTEHGLPYRPWVHFDLPLGWPWLFFCDYDAARNPLDLPAAGLEAAMATARRLGHSDLADSSCFDFHKLGFTPYASSMFLTRDWRDLRAAFGAPVPSREWLEWGTNFRQHHTIEHSRSAAPIVASWVSLQCLGRNGFRAYLAHLHSLTGRLRAGLTSIGMSVVNEDSPSLATLFRPDFGGGSRESSTENEHRYVEGLFRYISGLSGEADNPLAIGYIPGYAEHDGSAPAPVLRIYLANPHLSVTSIDEALKRIDQLKTEFDGSYDGADLGRPFSRLTHTPK